MILLITLLIAVGAWLMPVTGRAAPAADAHYSTLVGQAGTALAVSPKLIQAVIVVESNYDAGARSSAGALGLMQLMPKSGAREAYRYLYGADGIPTDESLLRPEVSVWLGTAYLKLLGTHYFGWIDDAGTRLLAVIAAYNWGPTRVLKRLFPKRQQISAQAFVARVWAQAPVETQRYLQRVMSLFQANDGQAAEKLVSR